MKSVAELGSVVPAIRAAREVFGYQRVSSAEQAREGKTSLTEQTRRIRERAAELEIPDPEIYSDEGVSGGIALAERPKGGELLRQLRRGSVVIANRLDRVFRDTLDAEITARAFEQAGIDLIVLDLGPDSVTSGSSVARLQFNMLAAFAAFERNRIRERTLEGRAVLRAKGYHPGGTPPFGSRVVEEGRYRRLVEDEGEQAVLKAVCLKWDQSKPMKRILRELFAEGYRNRKGTPIRSAEVYRWVQQPGRVNNSARMKKIQARRKACGERVGNPRIAEMSAKGLAQILADVKKRAVEVTPHIEQAIAGGCTTYRAIAAVLNALNLPTARGGRWHASSVRNTMLAAGLSFPVKQHRRGDALRAVLTPAVEGDPEIAKTVASLRLGKAQKQTAAILKLTAAGHSVDAISRILGLSDGAVRSVQRLAGRRRSPRNNGLSGADIERRNAAILAWRQQGLGAPEIAKQLPGVSEAVIYGVVQMAAVLDPHLAFGRARMNSDELREIAELRARDVPVPVIARKLGRSLRSVYRVIAMLPDMPGEYVSARMAQREREVAEITEIE
jgi:DNA invertase Pin-like site-specific DNA recombinase